MKQLSETAGRYSMRAAALRSLLNLHGSRDSPGYALGGESPQWFASLMSIVQSVALLRTMQSWNYRFLAAQQHRANYHPLTIHCRRRVDAGCAAHPRVACEAE